MTDLGTLVFSAVGLLFVAFVGAMIWLALRGRSPVTTALSRDGWKVEKPDRAPVKWSARRVRDGVAMTIELTSTGMSRNRGLSPVSISSVDLPDSFPRFRVRGQPMSVAGATQHGCCRVNLSP
jgi:hypothetical protein